MCVWHVHCYLYVYYISVETTTSYMRSIKDIFSVFMKDRKKHRKFPFILNLLS